MIAELGAVGGGAVLELVGDLAGHEQQAGLRSPFVVEGCLGDLECGDRAAVAAERIEAESAAEIPEAALYLLALIDVETLATVPHNIGKLYRMPDVRNSEVFEEFQPALRELTAAYGRLGADVVSGPVAATVSVDQLGGLLIQVVEVVIRIRSRGEEVTSAQAGAVAATCLRICGVPEEIVARATVMADDLLLRCAEEQRA